MSNEEKIDKMAPHLIGMYFETNDSATEMSFPPVEQYIILDEDIDEKNAEVKVVTACNGTVKVTEEGNRTYAWYYLTNNGDKYSGVTIEKQWTYQGRRRRQTARVRLYPGEHKEVFSFPRNQRPTCGIISCNIE